MIWVWLVFAVLLAIVEMLTLGFGAAFLALGAAAAALVAALGADLLGQALAFLVVSVLGIVAVRPLLVGYRNRHRGELLRSGAEAMIGQSAVVVEAGQAGGDWAHVRIGGENWPAVNRDGHPLQVGQAVEVVALQGTALVVTTSRTRR